MNSFEVTESHVSANNFSMPLSNITGVSIRKHPYVVPLHIAQVVGGGLAAIVGWLSGYFIQVAIIAMVLGWLSEFFAMIGLGGTEQVQITTTGGSHFVSVGVFGCDNKKFIAAIQEALNKRA